MQPNFSYNNSIKFTSSLLWALSPLKIRILFSQVHMFEKWQQFSNNEGKLTWPHHHGYVNILNEEQVLHTLCYVFHKPSCFCFNILGPCACPLETTWGLPKGYVMW